MLCVAPTGWNSSTQLKSRTHTQAEMMDENSRGWDSGGGMVLETLRKRGWCLEDTDGHYEITTVEYSHIPSIPNNVVLGTKVMPFLL